ncbi:MAG: hypothetical protein UHI54_07125 [Bifidobacterium merycicum]|uniref:hypothetical protein n=1 Tax=Bifidobacterium merycicum TaxID=78345 RepID=UPI002E79C2F9|nr:hypothetical protein [Bifidobacterium merycicum]MEE1294972.1 hypothetical protein [Bifidobacterium merycicum]
MAAAAAFVLTFVRPAGFTGMSSLGYALLVAVVVVVLGVPPLIMYALRRPDWDMRSDQEKRNATGILVNPPRQAKEAR